MNRVRTEPISLPFAVGRPDLSDKHSCIQIIFNLRLWLFLGLLCIAHATLEVCNACAEPRWTWLIAPMAHKLPSLVIVGRPNVGKSTLFNRLTGTRRAIVTNEPGITRDRIYGKAEWRGKTIEVVDTGGIIPDDKALIPQEILRQAHVAIAKASLLVLVADSQAGITPLDEELARLLRATGKPFYVAVNKVDVPSQETLAGEFHSFGVPVFPIADEHGTGVNDLLNAALDE